MLEALDSLLLVQVEQDGGPLFVSQKQERAQGVKLHQGHLGADRIVEICKLRADRT